MLRRGRVNDGVMEFSKPHPVHNARLEPVAAAAV